MKIAAIYDLMGKSVSPPVHVKDITKRVRQMFNVSSEYFVSMVFQLRRFCCALQLLNGINLSLHLFYAFFIWHFCCLAIFITYIHFIVGHMRIPIPFIYLTGRQHVSEFGPKQGWEDYSGWVFGRLPCWSQHHRLSRSLSYCMAIVWVP